MFMEPSRRVGKGKYLGKRTKGKEKDDFDWRSDPCQPLQTSPTILGGYKSLKHRWAAMYENGQGCPSVQHEGLREATKPAGAAGRQATGNVAEAGDVADVPQRPQSASHEQHVYETLWQAEDRGVVTDERQRIAPLPPAKRIKLETADQVGKDAEHRMGHMYAEAQKVREQSEREIRDQSERSAQQQTEASLAKEQLESAARNAQKQAEMELAEAAEHDRGAQAASSLQREAHERPGPDPLQEAADRQQDAAAQASQRSSENAEDTSADMQQGTPALSASGKHSPSPRPLDCTTQHASTGQAPVGSLEWPHKTGHADRGKEKAATSKDRNKQNVSKQSPLQQQLKEGGSRAVKKRKLASEARTAKEELVAETKGRNKPSPAPEDPGLLTSSRVAAAHEQHGMANGSVARDPHPLMPVTFIEGDEKEHLGELDLNQLDSFRDLWLTIRSAYSARLPKGDLKLVYQDIDSDLMQLQQDEPWENFKLVARGIFLAKNKS